MKRSVSNPHQKSETITQFNISSYFFRFVVSLVTMSAIYILLSIIYGMVPLESRILTSVKFLGLGAIFLFAYYFFFEKYEKRKVDELKLSLLPKSFSVGFIIGCIIICGSVLCYYLAGAYRIDNVDLGTFIISGFAFQMFIAIAEEILFRGVIYRMIENKAGTVTALIISSLLFGFMHIFNENATLWSSFAISIEAGVLLGLAYRFSKNLWMPIGIHCAWNFLLGTIWGLPVSGMSMGRSLFISTYEGPQWLTGGDFGPENSVPTVLICIIISIVFISIKINPNKLIKIKEKQKNKLSSIKGKKESNKIIIQSN